MLYEDVGAGVSAGRGSGRPPGAPQKALTETLAAIHAQLVLQTTQMGKLAQKEDVLEVSHKVDALSMKVSGHSKEI